MSRRVWEQTETGLVSREPDADDEQRRAAQRIGFPTERASLPETYERARQALSECARVDEVQQWNDKAWALQAYARQIHDDDLMRMALRIRLRAMRRMGLMLADIDKRGWARSPKKAEQPSKADVAKAAGLSMHTLRNATRIASMSDAEFEEVAESVNPPSVSRLASQIPRLKPIRQESDEGDPRPEGPRPIWPSHDAIRELRDAAQAYVKRLPSSQGRRIRAALHALGPLDEYERDNKG